MNRIQSMFQRTRNEGRGALSIYLPAGHPDLAASEAHIRAAIAGGADFLEIGVPFSDPAADGPVIEAATAAAIRNGVTVAAIFQMVANIRADHPDVPLVCMTYANIAFQFGWDGFADAIAEAGFDGAILADIPLEESAPVRASLERRGLAWIPLVTPTTPGDRMERIAATATGFLYVVANVGTTGQGDPGPLVESVVAAARAAGTDLPLAVGFGLRTADDVARVRAAGADAAIVGSAVVASISDGASPAETEAMVRGLGHGTNA